MTPIAAPATPAIATAGDTSRLATRANLDQAGAEFEAVFIGMMMQAMRKANLADSLFESKALDTFRDMQDTRVAQAMAEHAPIGIGKAMTEFLARAQPDLNQAASTDGA